MKLLFTILTIFLTSLQATAETPIYTNGFSSQAEIEQMNFGHGNWSRYTHFNYSGLKGETQNHFAMATKQNLPLPPVYFVQTRFSTCGDTNCSSGSLFTVAPYLLFNFRDARNYKFITLRPPRQYWSGRNYPHMTTFQCVVGQVQEGQWRVVQEFPCVEPIAAEFSCTYFPVSCSPGSTPEMGWAIDFAPKHLSVKVDGTKAHVFIEGAYRGTVNFRFPMRANGVGLLVHGANEYANFDYLNVIALDR